MQIKFDQNIEEKVPQNLNAQIDGVIKVLPREHLRGLGYIRFVQRIEDTRSKARNLEIPALYHPRQGTQPAWLEISTEILVGPTQPLRKRLMLRLSFKSNLAALVISLVGQHYYSTLRHSVKRGQMEQSIRNYTEKHLKLWSRSEHKFRMRLFKPFEPHIERWAKSLQKKAAGTKAKP
ncbi:MAG: hypothetical protein LC785_04475 [Acidobacteria bacterium]|nr:hypothetical protein [Acidobacteriota bacterium]